MEAFQPPPEQATPAAAQASLPPKRTPLDEFWRLFRRNRMAILGMAIFATFLITAVAGLILTAGASPVMDPSLIRLQEKLRPPLALPALSTLRPHEVPATGIYLLGTDDLGRDVLARMLQGAWVSLTVGFVAVGISVVIGIFLGGMAGYYGQHRVRIGQMAAVGLMGTGASLLLTARPAWGALLAALGFAAAVFARRRQTAGWLHVETLSIDTLIMRLVDIMLCFPSFFLILTVVALMPASIYNIMVVIGLTSWMGTTRFVRAEFLALREQDFVAAAKALGVGQMRIIFRHIMPNAVAPVLVSATIGIASAILTEAGLSFLGFGVPPPHATWGNILSDGKGFIFDAPWLTFAPGLAILVVVLAFNLFGEGLRDALNPKLRERH